VVAANLNYGGVSVEVVDSVGDGFRTLLDPHVALDAAMRLVAAVMRLRGVPCN
jgi:hypothetical protein